MITIVEDRYNGSYSNARWTAWDLDPELIPDDIAGSDSICNTWWREYEKEEKDEYSILVGKGNTPQEALDALLLLKEERTKIRIAEFRKQY